MVTIPMTEEAIPRFTYTERGKAPDRRAAAPTAEALDQQAAEPTAEARDQQAAEPTAEARDQQAAEPAEVAERACDLAGAGNSLRKCE
jgi:hypothetical protein